MKNILLFGAGKSSTVLIDYLKKVTSERNWSATIVDANYHQVAIKTSNHKQLKPVELDINDTIKRGELIQQADIVISLMPPSLHILIAKDCIKFKKNLLTASYIDDATKALAKDVLENDLIFLYEMGLDPGIDHMSAMQLIHKLKANGETITKFRSHCGGLVAPESDDNPFHYKISWNPRNVVMAGKDGATFKDDNQLIHLTYEDLFTKLQTVTTPTGEVFGFYPNRDSLSYINLYNISTVSQFIRTTLRHPDFLIGWKNLIYHQLTNENKIYDTNGMSLQQFFREHLKATNMPNWVDHLMNEKLEQINENISNLLSKMEYNEITKQKEVSFVDDDGNYLTLNEEEVNQYALQLMLNPKNDATKVKLDQLRFLGLTDEETIINKGLCSAADVMQFALETKLPLQSKDKDRVVMLHEIETVKNNVTKQYKSLLDINGENNVHTAMAKTVGLPLGIAATLILDGVITTKGLQIPITPEIYNPILLTLETEGIEFKEFEQEIRMY
ncbi:MAG: saccharopine dehydrogenase C-terminal domain-containing protein [Chitinophagaceae bacterium]